MAKTIQELFTERNTCKHQETIYLELINFLGQFIEDETHRPDRTLMTDGLGPVPQELIQEVIDKIQSENVEPLAARMSSIEGMKVEHGKEGKTNGAPIKKQLPGRGKEAQRPPKGEEAHGDD